MSLVLPNGRANSSSLIASVTGKAVSVFALVGTGLHLKFMKLSLQ
jgi:hypothetical protein